MARHTEQWVAGVGSAAAAGVGVGAWEWGAWSGEKSGSECLGEVRSRAAKVWVFYDRPAGLRGVCSTTCSRVVGVWVFHFASHLREQRLERGGDRRGEARDLVALVVVVGGVGQVG